MDTKLKLTKDERAFLARKKIVESMMMLHKEHRNITNEVLRTYLEMRLHHGDKEVKAAFEGEVLQSVVGNNLRILRADDIVMDFRERGKRYWKLTGKKLETHPPVKVLIPVPYSVNEQVTKMAKRQRATKVSVFVELLKVALAIEKYPLDDDSLDE